MLLSPGTATSQLLVVIALAGVFGSPAHAAPDDPPLTISRAAGAIEIDGELSDHGWQGVVPITTWFETNPGDNTPPPVANVGYLTYDDRFLYAALVLADDDPAAIRAPFVDRDNVGSPTDYAGIIVDTRNDRRSAMMFLANPRGIQYDALTDDASGEDSSPDFFWDSAARITATGWTLEIRIPFSSLRYATPAGGAPPIWGLMFYRNHPRDYRNQYFTARLPRDSNCFICNATRLVGLENLPTGSHITVAPYGAASQSAFPRAGLGSSLDTADPTGEVGADLKWTPTPDHVIDATYNPDFSQIEADVAQISANERFALFFPEKRPFFLEGVDLLATPIQAVYTRTITHPDWGARATGKLGSTAYTLLLTRDAGGGSVILPGAEGSGLANQDFTSDIAIARVRHDLGSSFISFLSTNREIAGGDGGGHNRVFGPDFRWKAGDSDTVSGQFLYSDSTSPDRLDLADTWDGENLSGHAAKLAWSHGTSTWDWYLQGMDVGDDFRADLGYLPQVGFREGFGELGYTLRPKGFVRRLRFYQFNTYQQDQNGELLFRETSAGVGLDAKWSSFARIRWAGHRIRVGGEVLASDQLVYTLSAVPGQRWSYVSIDGSIGDAIDFANGREGSGGTVALSTTVRPNDHLQLDATWNRRWLDVDEPAAQGRLFTAEVQRLKATYTFDRRMYLRLIGQYVTTDRRPDLYNFAVDASSGDFASSLLFAFKLNWQTVLFVGVGDSRAFDQNDELKEAGREAFLKVSYAFQR